MRIVLLGAPGSGKGTQGKLLSSKHAIPQISTGDLLRAAVSAGTALGRQAKAAMDAGQLVSDDIVLGIIGERLGEPDAANGFILDGFPRNLAQAEALDRMLVERGTPLQAALLIDVEVEALIERLTGRRTCESCGQMYNVYTSPPRLDDRCDKCGGNLRHRADDNEETISNRLRVYDQQTSPLIAYYRAQDKLKSVRGEGEINGIFAEIEKVLRKLPAGVPPLPAAAETEEKPSLEDLRKMVLAAASGAKPEKPAAKKKPAVKPAAPAPVPAKAEPKAPAAAEQPSTAPKKAAAKKAVAKKAAVKKAPAEKKPAVKKAAAKKAVATKSPAKKAAVKKAGGKKKPAAKKVVAKKAGKKAAVKKAPAKKKAVSKKKPAVKKAAAKKSVAKKSPAKKAVVKKAGGKKKPAAKKKSAAKKKR